jgi:hypothetical protein
MSKVLQFKLFESIVDDKCRCEEILAYLSDDGFIVDVYLYDGIVIDIDKGKLMGGVRKGFKWDDISNHILELRAQLGDEYLQASTELCDIYGNSVFLNASRNGNGWVDREKLGSVRVRFFKKNQESNFTDDW